MYKLTCYQRAQYILSEIECCFFSVSLAACTIQTASDNVFTQRSWSSLTFRVLFDPLTQPNCSMLPRERRQRGDIPLLIPLSLTLCPGRNSLWQPQLGSVAAAHYQAHYPHRQRERQWRGGSEVQGWWLKFMCHLLIWCERAQHTHIHTGQG